MSSPAPAVISFDITGTLATIDGTSHVDRIIAASPLPPRDVRRILTETLQLKILPSPGALTPELLATTCGQLKISVDDFPYGRVPLAPYMLLPGAWDAVAAAAGRLPVVLTSNTSPFADPDVMTLRLELMPHLLDVFLSWQLGVAKPDPAIYIAVAKGGDVTPDRIIHIGDSWTDDIEPVLRLGGRAVWINPDKRPVIYSTFVSPDRLLIADDVTHAVDQVQARWLS